ncbi:branched-chain amino acid ABC transporter permease [Chelatococcus reniformis]|uniref:Branched-chain amino acid ABC transporter permease n=1 Tax=Chelatococcus reniformis TaxID=1494448 RepID=A0A916TXR4_9HYPH|nr:branched-chain amino acid ABC transporter permease [Chelatococcus reniformis]GGC47820.1 branched-chain amino acid ABC transporter permease [Chelatococcus reniformis]
MGLDIAQTLIDGLMVGGLYATVALGITLVFGLVGILNFAHGQSVMLGAYVTFFGVQAGLGFWLSAALAVLAMAAFGAILEQLVFRRTLGDHMAGLAVSLGLIMVIENLAAATFSPDPRFVDPPVSGSIMVGPLQLSSQRLLVLAISTALIGGFYLFLQRATLGKAIRAMAQNRQGAALVGVRVSLVSRTIFTIGSALAGAAGALYASLFAVTPYMGNTPLTKGFILAALGGLGSVPGAIAAGFLLGIAESFGSRYLSASFRDGYGFILLILALLFLPTGLFGAGKARV